MELSNVQSAQDVGELTPSGRVSAQADGQASFRVGAPVRWLLVVTPTVVVVVADALRRGQRLASFETGSMRSYALACAESALVWGLLLLAAARTGGATAWLHRGLFVIAATLAFGGQQYFFDQYSAYLNFDVAVFATDLTESVWNQLTADIGNYVAALLPALLGASVLVWAAWRALRPTRLVAGIAAWVSPAVLCASFFVPTEYRHVQPSTPDILYLHAIGGVIQTQLGMTEQSDQVRPTVRHSLPVTDLPRDSVPPRNVVLVILESVRADSACSLPNQPCLATPYSAALVPDRIGFEQLRSLDSCTAISLAVLWSGIAPTEPRDVLHSWPLIFDYARAAGYDAAFWTSQNMLFGNARLWVQNLGVSEFCSATELDPACDLDMGAPENLLAQRVKRDISKLREPFLAVIQLSNVHYPYLVDDEGPAPFQPSTPTKDNDDFAWFFNHYRNAVHQQDRHVAEMIRAVRDGDRGGRTVIVYTSDHGEGFRDHGGTGHTYGVFDEEIKVPGWVDAPPGTLSAEELSNLRRHAADFSFHTDVTPTILDLMGVWTRPEIDRYRSKMLGMSWLRQPQPRKPQPLTNCAGVWSCAFENWGYMLGSLKLHSRSWDAGFQCFDVLEDPAEYTDLGLQHCRELHELALKTFGRAPGM